MTATEIRNPKPELRNKRHARVSKHQTSRALRFEHSSFRSFEFISYFALRASCFAFYLSTACAVEPFPRIPPTPPEKAEATFEVQHGFRMELIAAEPLVVDPVDLAYDEDGRAYVVEMRDYPLPEEKDAKPTVFPGTVRLLEDADGDGKFDKATIFADQLAWPTSVCCYKRGVFVAAAPDIWYFKDTDGDRKADVRRKVFTGFGRYNVQAIMNSLRWGLDNKIYGAAAGNGGTVQKVVGTVPVPSTREGEAPAEPAAISLTRRDFRFDPVTEKIEAIAGGERYGATFDDWGNRFLCNIRNPVQHVVLPLEYVQRNPHLVVPRLVHDCAESGDQLRVYRISPPEPWREFRAQRWSLEGANMPRSELIGAGYWTSSSGVSIYRGGAYPEPFRGNVFIGEVAGNLIHRQILTRDGVTFKSRRADENTEFVRSRDNWFRPVNFINAPDGTLTVLDMYRETIEHPWSIPDDIKSQLDLTSGNDRGRLYRLAPPSFTTSKPAKLSTATTSELVSYLESPHSWYRETAQRLLFERRDLNASLPLRQLLAGNAAPQAKPHALHLLSNWGELRDGDIEFALLKQHPEVRRHAVALSEGRLQKSTLIETAVGELSNDGDMGVRCQVALSIGPAEDPLTFEVLLQLAARDGHDVWMRTAILSSVSNGAGPLLKLALEREVKNRPPLPPAILLKQLASIVAAAGAENSVLSALNGVSRPGVSLDTQLAVISGLGEGLVRRRQRLADYLQRLDSPARSNLESLFEQLSKIATSSAASKAQRIASIELRAIVPDSSSMAVLVECMSPTQPWEVQQTALRVLGSFNEPAVASELLSRWKQLTPPLREEVVNVLLSRPIWHDSLISALETGEVPISQVSIPQRTRLAAIKDEKVADRAKKILASFVVGPRKDVIDRYQDALKLTGDRTRGQLVYRRECMNCHRLRGEGHDVGPSLETVQHRSPQEILIHVLDPNREVSPNFLEYTVRLTDGRVLTGVIANESDSGLTLRRAQNQEDSILRAEIDDIASSGKSLMPEGVEQKISPQEMADLIAYLKKPE
jgi:putative membrane-bound dehydrogenase-like protein